MQLRRSAAEFDTDVRVAIADAITAAGSVPRIAEIAVAVGAPIHEVAAAFDRLAAAKVLIARPGSSEILAFNPFSADPTDFHVSAAGREWWAVCGWDALGIPAALGTDGAIVAKCGDCGDGIELEVRGGTVDGPPGIVLQFGLPALGWWKDIIFT